MSSEELNPVQTHPLVVGLLQAIIDSDSARVADAERAIAGELRSEGAPEVLRELARQVHQLAWYFQTEVRDAGSAKRVMALLRRVWPHLYPKLASGPRADPKTQAALRAQHRGDAASVRTMREALEPGSSAGVGLQRGSRFGVQKGPGQSKL